MRKILTLAIGTLLLMAGLFTAASATATVSDPEAPPPTAPEEECVPSDAWTETIEHPAVYETVHHDAEYATEYEYVKQVRGVVQKKGIFGWSDIDTFDWEIWSGGSTKWSETDTDVLESGPHNAVQSEWTEGHGIFKKYYRELTTEYRYVPTGETRQGELIKDAWDEEVLVKDAWTETIEHPAVTCEDPDPEDPPIVIDPEDPAEPETPAPPANPVTVQPSFTG